MLLLLITSISGAVIASTLFFSRLNDTTAIDSSLLSNGEIVLSIVLAIHSREKLDRSGYVAIALVLIGVVMVTTNLQFALLTLKDGNLLIIGATLFWGLDNKIIRIIVIG